MEHIIKHTKRVGIAIIGTIILVVGIVLIPYPGPGWLIVFAGLAVLATEFKFAQAVLDKIKRKYDEWQTWVKNQNSFVRILILAFTGLVVLLTLWFVNSFGVVGTILNIDVGWLQSPLFPR